jgi:hypothetical protein
MDFYRALNYLWQRYTYEKTINLEDLTKFIIGFRPKNIPKDFIFETCRIGFTPKEVDFLIGKLWGTSDDSEIIIQKIEEPINSNIRKPIKIDRKIVPEFHSEERVQYYSPIGKEILFHHLQ